jgi:hypothetical protein
VFHGMGVVMITCVREFSWIEHVCRGGGAGDHVIE